MPQKVRVVLILAAIASIVIGCTAPADQSRSSQVSTPGATRASMRSEPTPTSIASPGAPPTPPPVDTARPTPPARTIDLASTEWVLSTLRGASPSVDATLAFTTVTNIDGRVGSCYYGGIYTSTDDRWLAMRPGPYVDPGCGKQVRSFKQVLESAVTYGATEDRLTIRDSSGETILTFNRNRAPRMDPALRGPYWILESMKGGPPKGLGAGLSFGYGDQYSGTAGCNDYFGTVRKAYNGKLHLGGAGHTDIGCDAIKYEHEYRLALTEATSYNVDGTRLVLEDASSREILVYRRYRSETDPSLVESEWELTSLRGNEPSSATKITLSFTMTWIIGSTGCGSYVWELAKAHKGTFVLSDHEDALTTAVKCPTGLEEQEQAYLEAIGETRTFKVQRGTLEMRDRSGQTVLVFRRR